MTSNRPVVLGLAGGVAAGKSVVAEMLRALGAVVVDADRLGHAVLEEEDVKKRLRDRWGDRVFDADERVNRRRLGAIVFADEESRRFLNGLVHPRIRERMRESVKAAAADGAELIVLDAALLFESGLERWCDATVFVDAPRDVRRRRARGERGWTPDEVDRREAAQTPPDEKRRQATYILDNSGDLEQTRRDVAELRERVLTRGPAGSAEQTFFRRGG